MNLANKLTILRIVLVPFMVFFLVENWVSYNHVWAFVIFLIASLTDVLDGKIARATNAITNFGKLLDPIADKILIISAMICMTPNICHPFIVIVVLFRDFIVSSLRLLAASQNIIIAANRLGKLKTLCQTLSISVVLFLLSLRDFAFDWEDSLIFVSNTLLSIAAAMAVVSGLDYIYQNHEAINWNESA